MRFNLFPRIQERRERASARRLFEPPSRPSFDQQFSQDISAGLPELQSRDESLEQASQSFVDAIPVIEPPDISDIWNDIDVSKPDVGNEKLDALSFDVKNKQQSLRADIEERVSALGGLNNPSPRSSIVAQWNERALEAIRAEKPVPTVITRSLHIVHAAMYDAWAAYDTAAAGAYFNPNSRRFGLHQSASNGPRVEQAVSSAAFHTLSELFPGHVDSFEALLDDLGHDFRGSGYRLGREAAQTVLEARDADGSNASNNYADTSGYAPQNHPDDVEIDPNHWTPLKIPTGTVVDDQGIPIVTDDLNSFDLQSPLTPHWGSVEPFALSYGSVYRPVAPPQLGDDTPYEDALGAVSSNDAAYRKQFGEVAQLSADLTDQQKVIAEYWADGPQSSTPPGHWNEFAHDLALRDQHDLADDVKFFFALNNALFDTGIAIWDAKYAHDYVRPQTAIRHLYADQEILSWGGPNQGTQLIDGSTWQPYQDVTFVTPAFPEYTSGHSGFSFAAATVLEAFTGSDVLYDGVSRGAQDFDGDGEPDLIGSWSTEELAFENYSGDPITLQWSTLWDAAAEAGRSRLYGGIHIQDGDLRAREMGVQVAKDAWTATTELFTAEEESSSGQAFNNLFGTTTDLNLLA